MRSDRIVLNLGRLRFPDFGERYSNPKSVRLKYGLLAGRP